MTSLSLSVSNFRPDTRGWWWTLFRLTCLVMLWGGRNAANVLHWHVFAVSQPHWICPSSQRVCFLSLYCSGSRLFCWELSETGPGLHALPRSKPLRFRYSGTPQRCNLGWACVLCPSQVQAAQVTRCLESAVAVTYRLPHPCHLVFWVYNQCTFSGVLCLFWGADLWL